MTRGGSCVFFFFNDTATTEIYTLSLHDALPISGETASSKRWKQALAKVKSHDMPPDDEDKRSEEHTSELQSQSNLVCRLLLEKKMTSISLKGGGSGAEAQEPSLKVDDTPLTSVC